MEQSLLVPKRATEHACDRPLRLSTEVMRKLVLELAAAHQVPVIIGTVRRLGCANGRRDISR
jgi:hypothetical protein